MVYIPLIERGDKESIHNCCKICNISGNTMIHGVKLIGTMVQEAPSELRIKALDTVCSITKLQVK